MTRLGPSIQAQLLENRREPNRGLSLTRVLHELLRSLLRLVEGVLDVQDRLFIRVVDERLVLPALIIVSVALLVDLPVTGVDDLRDDIATVLQPVAEAGGMCGPGEEFDVVDAVLFREVEACVVAVAIDVVGVHAVAALFLGLTDALLHQCPHLFVACVDPLLARPAIHDFANGHLWNLVLVLAPIFPA